MHRKQFVYIIVTSATRVKPNLDFSTTFFLFFYLSSFFFLFTKRYIFLLLLFTVKHVKCNISQKTTKTKRPSLNAFKRLISERRLYSLPSRQEIALLGDRDASGLIV